VASGYHVLVDAEFALRVTILQELAWRFFTKGIGRNSALAATKIGEKVQ